MLVSFHVANFRSFDTGQTLDLRVSKAVAHDRARFAEPLPGLYVARVAVVLGPNASGKSNLIGAMSVCRDFVSNSVLQQNPVLRRITPFARLQTFEEPTTFEVEYVGTLHEQGQPSLFRYRVDFFWRQNRTVVKSESLHHAPNGKMRRLFERDGDTIRAGEDFALRNGDPRLAAVREDASVIATLAQLNHAPSQFLASRLAAVGIVFSIGRGEEDTALARYAHDNALLQRLNTAITGADLGIKGVDVMARDGFPVARFSHAGLDAAIEHFEQSTGTRRYVALFPIIDEAIRNGTPLIIDELDTALHPMMLRHIVEGFQQHDAQLLAGGTQQLIATCHSPTILDDGVVKEEIWFTEKQADGSTRLFAAADFRGLRRSVPFYRYYMDGALGAVPRIG